MLAAALLVACTHGTPLAVRATPTQAATGTAPESVVRAVQAATDPISAAEALTSFMISAMSGKLAQDSLTAAGGVEAIARHLISGDSNTRGAAALALAHLTSNVEGVAEEQPVAAQAALVKAGAIGTLVSSLSHETDWTLLEATIHALYNALVLCEPAQDALVDAGGVEALSLQLNDVRLSKKARSAVLLTLRALSSLARVKEAVLDAGTIDALAAFAAANRDDEVVQQETFNALYELSQEHHRNAAKMREMGIRFSKEGEGEKSKFKALHDALHEKQRQRRSAAFEELGREAAGARPTPYARRLFPAACIGALLALALAGWRAAAQRQPASKGQRHARERAKKSRAAAAGGGGVGGGASPMGSYVDRARRRG